MPDTIVVPDEGALKIADWWRGNGPAGNATLELRLAKNAFPTAQNLTLADFVEATFGGYNKKTLNYNEFGAPGIVNGKARVRLGNGTQSFLCTGNGGSVTGWYLVDTASGKVYAACLYDAAVAMVLGMEHRVDVYLDHFKG